MTRRGSGSECGLKVPLLESHKRAVGAGVDENAGGTKGAVRERMRGSRRCEETFSRGKLAQKAHGYAKPRRR